MEIYFLTACSNLVSVVRQPPLTTNAISFTPRPVSPQACCAFPLLHYSKVYFSQTYCDVRQDERSGMRAHKTPDRKSSERSCSIYTVLRKYRTYGNIVRTARHTNTVVPYKVEAGNRYHYLPHLALFTPFSFCSIMNDSRYVCILRFAISM